VLSQAHKAYVDLLSYLQTIRRPHPTKGTSGHNTSPKLLVYPKPPKPSLKFSDAPDGKEIAGMRLATEGDRRQDYHAGRNSAPQLQGAFGNYPSMGKATPFAGAKSSLDMLSSLCEQSSWNWIDGIMLGGCLHYGLEQYEEALEWFSRITTLDSR
jgi:hypothetical protein